ncbi:hypothetical protein [Halocatena salina]|uniref:Uncharacterized protein n=1 Tax=Halocatena salina TaxID=2934340 RepID=A0A8U0A7S4_9EURY|nr:hypothetical protein [Halocatena salina]UPM45251.1 hypothetical protein MW046_19080 [Halocatena salina]
MPALAGQGAAPTAVTADMFVLSRINLFVDNSPNMLLSGFDRIECRVDPLIVGVGVVVAVSVAVGLVVVTVAGGVAV